MKHSSKKLELLLSDIITHVKKCINNISGYGTKDIEPTVNKTIV